MDVPCFFSFFFFSPLVLNSASCSFYSLVWALSSFPLFSASSIAFFLFSSSSAFSACEATMFISDSSYLTYLLQYLRSWSQRSISTMYGWISSFWSYCSSHFLLLSSCSFLSSSILFFLNSSFFYCSSNYFFFSSILFYLSSSHFFLCSSYSMSLSLIDLIHSICLISICCFS